jgi:amidase
VPRYPNLLSWDTLAVEGVIARTIGDAALMLDAVSGPDEGIPISLSGHETEFLGAVENPTIKGSRIAWSDNLNIMPIDTEILEVARSTMGVFHGLGCEVVEDAPDFSGVRETALTLRGLRYVSLYQDQFDDPRFKKLVNPLVIGNIEEGLKLSIRDIARAERHRSELWQRVNNFLQNYDFLLTPTVAIPPFPAETIYPMEINGKPMEHYVDWIMLTYAITITCLPALSVPCGWTKGGLPVGLQIVGRRHGESRVLRAAAAYEVAAPWADKRPPLGQ